MAARAWHVLVLAFLVLWPAADARAMAVASDEVVLVDIEGAIGPATAGHVGRALTEARERDAQLVVLRIDTPGGLDAAMRDIIRAILASPVPVAGYVGPSGARAASAGTYIMLATHVAAMAPATTLGAATPVRIGGAPTPEQTEPRGDDDAPPSTSAEERKVVSDARAYIRGLATMRGRNAEWADLAVVESASLTADEALRKDVIELVADDVPALMQALDGRRVQVLDTTVVLHTADAPVHAIEPTWRTRLLSILVDPNLAYLLLILGFYGLFFELANPGFVVPGVVGAICLVLALFAFSTLPVNWAGLALIVLGVIFMIAEAFVPSFGALGLGGAVAFVVGSIILMESRSELFQLSVGLVIGVAIASAAFFIGVVGIALRSRRAKVVSGREALVGATAVALEGFTDTGQVRTHGEIWRARTGTPVHEGQRLRVRDVQALMLEVEPLEPDTLDDASTSSTHGETQS